MFLKFETHVNNDDKEITKRMVVSFPPGLRFCLI